MAWPISSAFSLFPEPCGGHRRAPQWPHSWQGGVCWMKMRRMMILMMSLARCVLPVCYKLSYALSKRLACLSAYIC